MKKNLFLCLVLFFCAFSQASHAAVLFSDLGTTAPPASLSTYTVTPFDQGVQAAIPTGTDVTTIPGSPIPGDLITTANVNKRAIGDGWSTWSHGYTGVVYSSNGADTIVMNLPPDAGAFYFYAEPNVFSTFLISAVTDSGASSGDISVNGSSGANGFAFYTTAGESITTITVTADPAANGFAIGEFGIAANQAGPEAIPTLNEWGMIILALFIAGISIKMIKKQGAEI